MLKFRTWGEEHRLPFSRACVAVTVIPGRRQATRIPFVVTCSGIGHLKTRTLMTKAADLIMCTTGVAGVRSTL